VTEDEARTKWCPMVRFVVDSQDDGANRWIGHQSPPECRCIASDCMMWRWRMPETLEEIEDCKGDGYCGLAR
jgi:hypothetical protein